MHDESSIERAIARALRPGRRLSRRRFLRDSGRGAIVAGSALSLPAILAACGIGPAGSTAGSAAPSASNKVVGGGEPAGTLNFANWPLYIDQDDNGKSETLRMFTEATGIEVNYDEKIEDNQSFFGIIQPALAAGEDTGYDLMVITDWLVGNMLRLGFLEEFDVATSVPNFVANAAPKYHDPVYDPDNRHSVPWQSGLTAMAYNPALVSEEITSLKQLFDPAFIEKYSGKIGMFTEMRDTMNLTLLYLGVDPAKATVADAERARDVLMAQAPYVRGYYGNDFAQGLADGSLAITMAWSGDIFQLQFDNPDLKLVVPEEGAILWVDNMTIPKGAQHPNDALAMMDFVYQPEIAAQITEYVNYICPVPAAQEVIRQHAEEADNQDDADYLNAVADSELVFPSEDMLSRTYSYKVLDEDEERQWNELFGEVVQG
ncbi:MAG: extracellular solute-binding protein [Chloroflexi bacterium]|nr:extracellular solute-binding protein [Chloroflexota bacterium]